MDSAADEMVAQSIEELALRLPHAHRLFRAADHDGLGDCAGAIATVAARIGMTRLARVAGDVGRCCETHDLAALAATHCRMIRLGECSLREIWDLQALPV